MYLSQFFVEGLGHASYLLASEKTHEAAIVDPRRDIDVYLDAARAAGVEIRYVLETHNHNDFVSGARALAELTGATHIASAQAELQFPYQPASDGDTLTLGEVTLHTLFTPGHTPEHVVYVATDTARGNDPVLAFTGGDLLVGSVGRPDLLGRELGERLAPMLYDSLHEKIMRLADYVEVLPTHGAGSLCGKSIGSKRTSTIGYERRFNPALQQPTKEDFVLFVLGGNPGTPTYYRRMRPTNQAGAPRWTLPRPLPLMPEAIRHHIGHEGIVIDARSALAFGGGHIPGALNIPLGPQFVTWVGWLVPHDVPLALVLERPDDWSEVVTALARIGYERVLGYLHPGMQAWIEAGLPLARTEQRDVDTLRGLVRDRTITVLDVRTDNEWLEGHIPGARHIPLGDLPERLAEVPREGPLAVICHSGNRSSIAASLLARHGMPSVINIPGGMGAWEARGYPMVSGEERKDAGHAA